MVTTVAAPRTIDAVPVAARGERAPDRRLVVEARGLTKHYGAARVAVDGLDLDVRAGEVYGLIGPNGAGKTTTLRMLLGLVRPTSGTARAVGARPGSPAGLARVGALIEGPAFYPYLSGRDNLRVLARYAGATERQVESALAQVALADRAGDAFGGYSLGMKQRLGVAGALLKEPRLLVLDEPTNGLDPSGIAEMRALMRRLGRGERTVLLSSHLLGEVEQVCDRVGLMHQGRLIAEGPVADLVGEPGLFLRADPPARAASVAERLPGVAGIEVDGDGLRLAVDPSRAAEVNAALVAAGLAVAELRPIKRSLEEVFFARTQGEGRR